MDRARSPDASQTSTLTTMSNSTPTFAKLNNYNYKTWSGDIQAWLMSKELWMLVDNQEPCPSSTEPEERLKWLKCAQKAAGELRWSGDIQAWLMSKELWMLVDNQEPCPSSTEPEERLKWLKCAQKAAGEL